MEREGMVIAEDGPVVVGSLVYRDEARYCRS
jgi:hypothetical protein